MEAAGANGDVRTQVVEARRAGDVRSVDVHIRRLRAKIGTDLPVVTTLRGVGYCLGAHCAVEIVDDPAWT
ncbi:helix-turn-helix domain-containing protein [Micromonospora sp. NPDC048063]|uniref:winged helix-turn-helix domain-containing protein n=1 Tax=Micromonospora sp. NPDC048063 TaxID=3364256 RepID=UPI00372121DE